MSEERVSSLYLSRLLLNPRSRQVMSEMAHPYEMHRTLMRAFPGTTETAIRKARDEFGVLFRAEADERSTTTKVYVQSAAQPDWSFLDGLGDYLRADSGNAPYEHRDILPALRKLQTGQLLMFRLRANPTKRVARDGDAMKGKRVELRREEEQIGWLVRKGRGQGEGVPGGFELLLECIRDEDGRELPVPRVRVSLEGKQKGRKMVAERGHQTTHFAVLFDGLLRVTDTDALLRTLFGGIGTGKAFGFGLLSLARAQGEP